MDAIAARVDPYGFVDFDAFLKALSHFKERPDAGTEENEDTTEVRIHIIAPWHIACCVVNDM